MHRERWAPSRFDTELPHVFTPPRDHGEARVVFSPRASEEWDDETLAVTWQSISAVVKLMIAVLLTFAIALGLYTLATIWFGRQPVTDCADQPIPNGVFIAGKANSSAVVRCNEGFTVGDISKLSELKCRRFEETCEVIAPATTLSDEETACKDLYAFTIAGGLKSTVEVLEKEKEEGVINNTASELKLVEEEVAKQRRTKESEIITYDGPMHEIIDLWQTAHRTSVLNVQPTKAELHAIAEIEAVADQVAKDACVSLPWVPGGKTHPGTRLYSAKGPSLRAGVAQPVNLQRAVVPMLLVATVLALVVAGLRRGRSSMFSRTDEPACASEELDTDSDDCGTAVRLPAE